LAREYHPHEDKEEAGYSVAVAYLVGNREQEARVEDVLEQILREVVWVPLAD
jgi:hypothetical protein